MDTLYIVSGDFGTIFAFWAFLRPQKVQKKISGTHTVGPLQPLSHPLPPFWSTGTYGSLTTVLEALGGTTLQYKVPGATKYLASPAMTNCQVFLPKCQVFLPFCQYKVCANCVKVCANCPFHVIYILYFCSA